ncbi:hypothetical protein AB4Z48_34880 [Cupriavidus sp. 2TAF22]|uniref:hypothetical protein n=1 Tax=unclassified Cupriavidus TaxID=2640874 RepID=UPI003F8E20C8
MHRDLNVGDHRLSIQAEQKPDPWRPAEVLGYAVHYSIIRTDGRPVRPNFQIVESYELIDGTYLFPTSEAALDYGEAKAREDISTL